MSTAPQNINREVQKAFKATQAENCQLKEGRKEAMQRIKEMLARNFTMCSSLCEYELKTEKKQDVIIVQRGV